MAKRKLTVSERVAALCAYRGVSGADLARLMEWPRYKGWRIASGRQEPSASELEDLLHALGSSLSEFGGEVQ